MVTVLLVWGVGSVSSAIGWWYGHRLQRWQVADLEHELLIAQNSVAALARELADCRLRNAGR